MKWRGCARRGAPTSRGSSKVGLAPSFSSCFVIILIVGICMINDHIGDGMIIIMGLDYYYCGHKHGHHGNGQGVHGNNSQEHDGLAKQSWSSSWCSHGLVLITTKIIIRMRLDEDIETNFAWPPSRPHLDLSGAVWVRLDRRLFKSSKGMLKQVIFTKQPREVVWVLISSRCSQRALWKCTLYC